MSDINLDPKGVLLEGWSATVDDYAIAGGWACNGHLMVVGDASGGVFGFDGKSGVVQWKHPKMHDQGLMALAIHPNGNMFATSGQDGRVLIWNAKDGEVLQTVEVGRGWVEHLAWSSDGCWLAASLSRRVHVFDVEGREAWQSEDHPSTISAIAWSTPGELATACYGQVSFFDGATGALGQKLEWKGSLVSLALSSDGSIVVCGSQDNTVHFWRRATEEDSIMSGYLGKPLALAFDDTDTFLATGGGESVTVWCFEGDGPEGTMPGVLQLHVQSITTLSFASKSHRLASGARDGAVIVWDLEDDGMGEPVGAGFLTDVISTLAWRPDGRGLVALDATGGVTAWRVQAD